jgi:hypothetical protein
MAQQSRAGGSVGLGGMPSLKSCQVVGGAISQGTAGPYTTNFTLSQAVNPANCIINVITDGGPYWGNTNNGDYLKWALTSNTNLQVVAYQISNSGYGGNIAAMYFQVLEFYSIKGKVSVSTTISGTSAANFNVSYTAPAGASLNSMIARLTCQPLDYGNGGLFLTFSVGSLTQATFGMLAGNQYGLTGEPVQADILFY